MIEDELELVLLQLISSKGPPSKNISTSASSQAKSGPSISTNGGSPSDKVTQSSEKSPQNGGLACEKSN